MSKDRNKNLILDSQKKNKNSRKLRRISKKSLVVSRWISATYKKKPGTPKRKLRLSKWRCGKWRAFWIRETWPLMSLTIKSSNRAIKIWCKHKVSSRNCAPLSQGTIHSKSTTMSSIRLRTSFPQKWKKTCRRSTCFTMIFRNIKTRWTTSIASWNAEKLNTQIQFRLYRPILIKRMRSWTYCSSTTPVS